MPIDSLPSKYAKKKQLDPMVPCTILPDFRHVPIVENQFSDRGDVLRTLNLPKHPG